MFDDFSLDQLRTIRRDLALKMIENAGTASFSLPDGVSVSLDAAGIKEMLRLVDDAIKRRQGQRSRFIQIELR